MNKLKLGIYIFSWLSGVGLAVYCAFIKEYAFTAVFAIITGWMIVDDIKRMNK